MQLNIKSMFINIKKAVIDLFQNKLHSVILYGSFARGDFDEESDVDILVVVNATQEELEKYEPEIAKIASRLSMQTDNCRTISITLQDYETYHMYKNHLPYFKNIEKEGAVIYAA